MAAVALHSSDLQAVVSASGENGEQVWGWRGWMGPR